MQRLPDIDLLAPREDGVHAVEAADCGAPSLTSLHLYGCISGETFLWRYLCRAAGGCLPVKE
ncbi:hypothetical protein EYF80_030680 [Liparis tanakae]|uniref:Uncharacterized protein n=1 Tax=Liparis tanakae TaxID=230148 RepID=A0A4Z2H061_9TELE|nr:hypothetical protein EYF80_030680 [Liparis tanakae]